MEDGPNSYTQNSKFQEQGSNNAKKLIESSIEEDLHIQNNLHVFTIADLGCSVGPNTFKSVQSIIESVNLKLQSNTTLQFQVFFNDNYANDFNTLFKALPPERPYTATGVPGSFTGRLFPKESMNIMHSAFALHWLTKIPDEVTQKEGSPAWNRGRISYALSPYEVEKAFAAQFMRDANLFFEARSVEMASGGLTVVLMPFRPAGVPTCDSMALHLMECLGDALADMVNEGQLSQAILDSYNVHVYIPTASEVKEVISRQKQLNLQRMVEMNPPVNLTTPQDVKSRSLSIRSLMEGMLSNHFGSELIMDELFERYSLKLEALSKTARYARFNKLGHLFLLVKHNTDVSI